MIETRKEIHVIQLIVMTMLILITAAILFTGQAYAQGDGLIAQNAANNEPYVNGQLTLTGTKNVVMIEVNSITNEKLFVYVVENASNQVVERLVFDTKEGKNAFQIELSNINPGKYTFTLRGNYTMHKTTLIATE